MADRGAQARVRTWREAAQTLHHQCIQAVVEPFHRHHVHGGAALRLIRVQRNTITEFVQRTVSAAAAARCCSCTVWPKVPASAEIRRHRARRVPPSHVDGADCPDRRLRPAPARPTSPPAPRPRRRRRCRRPASADGSDPVRSQVASGAAAAHGHRGAPSDAPPLRRVDLVDGAPVVPVALAMHVPFGILPALTLTVIAVIDLRRWR